MNQDGVNTAFELMLGEICTVVEQLNEEGAAAFQMGEYAKAQTLGNTGQALKGFMEKVRSLRDEWNQGFDATTRSRVRRSLEGVKRRSHSKSPKTVLRVDFPDGTSICEKVAATSFVAAIKKIGVERVHRLGLELEGVPLVAGNESKSGQRKLGKYWIMTHSSTKNKKALIDKISKSLGLGLRVTVVR